MRFALISDVHFGPAAYFEGKLRKLTQHAAELCAAFVQQMNQVERPDLVINLGDVIEDRDREHDLQEYTHFLQVLSGLQAPVLHVAGNHDQINLAAEDLARLWGHGDKLYYSRDRAGVHFSVLATVEVADTAIRLPQEQLDWLAEDLARASAPCVVLMHHPASEMQLEGNRWFEHRPHVCRVAERRRLQRVVRDSGKVVAVFNGHVHWNHFDLVDGIPFVCLQSLVENLDDDAPGRAASAWAVCDLDAHRLSVRVAGAEPVRYQIELSSSPPRA